VHRTRKRNVLRPLHEVHDEVQEAVVRPLEVFEHEGESSFSGQGGQIAAPGGEGFGAAITEALPLLTDADQGPQMCGNPRIIHTLVQLLLGLLPRIALEDAELCLHDLAQSPEGDAVAVGQATTLAPGKALVRACKLVNEPALADSRLADERYDL
jgi:hypothetical protein